MAVARGFIHAQLEPFIFYPQHILCRTLSLALPHCVECIQQLVWRQSKPLFHLSAQLPPGIHLAVLKQGPDRCAQNQGRQLAQMLGLKVFNSKLGG